MKHTIESFIKLKRQNVAKHSARLKRKREYLTFEYYYIGTIL